MGYSTVLEPFTKVIMANMSGILRVENFMHKVPIQILLVEFTKGSSKKAINTV
jgi:hypothetical protein